MERFKCQKRLRQNPDTYKSLGNLSTDTQPLKGPTALPLPEVTWTWDQQLCTHLTPNASQSLKLSILPSFKESSPVRHGKTSKYVLPKTWILFSFLSKREVQISFHQWSLHSERDRLLFLPLQQSAAVRTNYCWSPPQTRMITTTLTNKKLVGPWARSEGPDTRKSTNLQQLGGLDCGCGRQDQPLWIHTLPQSLSEFYTAISNM